MKITLKDGSVERIRAKVCQCMRLHLTSAKDLPEWAMAGEVNGEVVDLRTVVSEDCELNILTFQDEGGKDLPSVIHPRIFWHQAVTAPLSGDEACYWASHCGRLLL